MSVCLCVFVCFFVCVWHLYSQNCYVDFDETLHNWSNIWLVISFLSIFDHLNLMTSWRPFWIYPIRHSHGCNFAPIFFKIEHKVQRCLPIFANENQQNWSVTSDFIENRAYDFSRFSPKIGAKIKIVRYKQ